MPPGAASSRWPASAVSQGGRAGSVIPSQSIRSGSVRSHTQIGKSRIRKTTRGVPLDFSATNVHGDRVRLVVSGVRHGRRYRVRSPTDSKREITTRSAPRVAGTRAAYWSRVRRHAIDQELVDPLFADAIVVTAGLVLGLNRHLIGALPPVSFGQTMLSEKIGAYALQPAELQEAAATDENVSK
jgi:hypothetical protein